MSTDLVSWVYGELDESDLDDAAKYVVIASLEGASALDAQLADGHAVEQAPMPTAPGVEVAAGTFLASIAVEGFRGIGAETRLRLTPGPGLTIVAGRNGSGKSSLSEALEFAMTGDTYRWKSKSSVEWRQAWRNLHHPHARITIRLVEEGDLPVTVTTTWADGATDVTTGTTKTQRKDQKQRDGKDELGWRRALEQYRPILSYDELGGLLESGRSQLYDALASILGVEQLSDGLKLISLRRKERAAPEAGVTARRKQLAEQAAALADERGAEAAELLRKTSPNVARLRALATGSAIPEIGRLQQLRALASLTLPFSADEAAGMPDLIRKNVDALDAVNAETSERSLGRLKLLESALDLHSRSGDMNCPVCRTGQLDDSWRTTSARLVAAQQEDLRELELARSNLALAVGKARHLIVPRPAVLNRLPEDELSSAVTAARDAWEALVAVPDEGAGGAQALALHLETRGPALLKAVAAVRGWATARLADLEDVWQPFAGDLSAWCNEWDACLADRPVVQALTAAEKWMKANDLRLKNERLAPIEEDAKKAWAKLRQESNVEIGSLALAGSGNRRHVSIDASVDGIAQQGIPVLSQGELHALALSLFIPRATMSGSPFRFLVLDDPIQAMDPAKVDGLVELLSDMAKTHQVIVLSHDDRLAAAVRRSPVKATVLEVTRGAGSQVTIETTTDPAQRYIDDASGLVTEFEHDNLPELAMRRTLPGLLRFAVEAAAKDRYYAARLTAGAPLDEVESAWAGASTTRRKVGLAVFLEERSDQQLTDWAAAPYRKHGLRNVGTAMHQGLKTDLEPRTAVRDVERLIQDLRSLK